MCCRSVLRPHDGLPLRLRKNIILVMSSDILTSGRVVLDPPPVGLSEHAEPSEPSDVAGQMARRRVADREAELAAEVRRLLKATDVLFRRCGTKESPRLADILAEAGLSNDAFYRHFKSKDELVAALMEDGSRRFCQALAARMATVETPLEKVDALVRGVVGLVADDTAAQSLRARMWNAARTADDSMRRLAARTALAQLLIDPLTMLGCADPERDARVLCDAALGRMEHFIWLREAPAQRDLDHIAEFCLRAISPSTPNIKEHS